MSVVLEQGDLVILPPFSKDDPANLFNYFLENDSSRQARQLLSSLSPSLRRFHQKVKPQMVLLPGSSISRDKPTTSVIRSFAGNLECERPHFFDALFLCKVITPSFFTNGINWMVIMHQSINGQVLGITCEKGKVILTANEEEPRKGWYARNGGFVFRAK